jgi:hypothetical protein
MHTRVVVHAPQFVIRREQEGTECGPGSSGLSQLHVSFLTNALERASLSHPVHPNGDELAVRRP